MSKIYPGLLVQIRGVVHNSPSGVFNGYVGRVLRESAKNKDYWVIEGAERIPGMGQNVVFASKVLCSVEVPQPISTWAEVKKSTGWSPTENV